MKNLTINVGDYVRTNDGYIAKYLGCKTNSANQLFHYFDGTIRNIASYVYDEDRFLWDDELKNIIKSSPNIKDLIEEFDYIKMNDWGSIKFWRVVKAPYGKLMFEDDGWNELEDFEDEEITEIITHEQMESIAYKAGE